MDKNDLLLLIGIYLLGAILTLVFFILFGKKLGYDYNPPYDDWYDDYDNNAQAYTTFAFGWFMIMPVMILGGCWHCITSFVAIFTDEKKEKKKEKNIITETQLETKTDLIL